MAGSLDRDGQFAALTVLDYARALFMEAQRETFTREEILVVLTCVMDDGELFDAELRAEYDEVCRLAEEAGVGRR